MGTQQQWWKQAVIYQVYPRSFKDGNNDGIGDLKGITSKIPYLKSLGIDVIWLSPHYHSPNIDNGYDIADYRAIMRDFGTMDDFDEMLHTIHQHALKLIIDLVVNHSSDEHEWFKQAVNNANSPYRNYYIWRKEIPNKWISFFSGCAWDLDINSNEYYLHLFHKKQPDLNWENPQLRDEVYGIMKYWLDKGVDGFRMDVISLIAKPIGLADFPEGRQNDLSYYSGNPQVHHYLQEMNKEVLSKYNCLTVGEAFGVMADEAIHYVGQERNELNMIYHFDHAVPRDEHCFTTPAPEFSLPQLKEIFKRWDDALKSDGWNTIYFGNHDNPRMLSRFGDTGKYWKQSAKMLATVLLTLRGTPFIYQGDEIGMSNANFTSIEEYNDVQVHNAYVALVEKKKQPAENFLTAANIIARDHARTPMQWSNEENAGFTNAAKPWLKVNNNYTQVNAAAQEQDRDSILNYYRTLIQLRKQHKVLVYGNYEELTSSAQSVWMYTRKYENNNALIMHNFSATEQTLQLDFSAGELQLLLANKTVSEKPLNNVFQLSAFESRIYLFK